MGMSAPNAYFAALMAGQRDLVSKADTLEDGPKLVKTIRPFSQNIENKI